MEQAAREYGGARRLALLRKWCSLLKPAGAIVLQMQGGRLLPRGPASRLGTACSLLGAWRLLHAAWRRLHAQHRRVNSPGRTHRPCCRPPPERQP
jgi:hypothetical protein